MSNKTEEILRKIVEKTPQMTLKFHSFSILYHGVLCILFEGFENKCDELKRNIESHPHFKGLKPEFGGSKFPKITLGVRKSAEMFSIEQFKKLGEICSKYSDILDFTISVKNLYYVRFQKRSLEKLHNVVNLELKEEDEDLDYQVSDTSSKIVRSIGKTFENEENMKRELVNINTEKGLLERYREDMNPGDETLVFFIHELLDEDSKTKILEFERDISKEFPFYEFFNPKSWHVTFRALENE